MATSTEEGNQSPKVKFRWCRTVPCNLSGVKLELSSLSQCFLPLLWKEELGWFESDFVSLPNGLHTGRIRVTIKNPNVIGTSDLSSNLKHFISKASDQDEHQLKVDPFYVSSHKFSIELFLQKEEANCWQTSDQPTRYLSCQQFAHQVDGDNSTLKERRCSSSYELSCNYEANKYIESKESPLFMEFLGEISTETESIAKKGLSYERKWRSLDHNISGSNDDSEEVISSRSAKSDSFKLVGELFNKIRKRTADHHKSLYDSAYSSTGRKDRGFDFWKINSSIKTQSINSLINSPKSEDETDGQEPTFDQQEITIGAEESIIDGEECNIDETELKNDGAKNYKCVITFESRSASMDDVGSPRALEEALVSLTSSENTDKNTNSNAFIQYYALPRYKTIIQDALKANQQTDLVRNSLLFNCQQAILAVQSNLAENPSPSSISNRSDESSSTLYDDVNFDYESSASDSEKLPLDFSGMISESIKSVDSDRTSSFTPVNSHKQTSCEEGESVCEFSENESQGRSGNSSKTRTGVVDHKRRRSGRKFIPETYSSCANHSDDRLKHSSKCDNSETECNSSVFSDDGSTNMLIKESGQKAMPTVREYKIRSKGMSGKPLKKEHVSSFKSSNHSNAGLKKRYASMMQTTGTQTSNRVRIDVSAGVEPATTKRLPFSILPDRIRPPYSKSFEKANASTLRFSKRDLADMQSSLYNLVKADNLLRKIHTVQDSISTRANIAARIQNTYSSSYYNSNVSYPLYRYSAYRPRRPVTPFSALDSQTRYHGGGDPLSVYGVQPLYYPPEKLRYGRYRGTTVERSQLRTMSSLPDLTSEVSESYAPRPKKYSSSRTIDTDWSRDKRSSHEPLRYSKRRDFTNFDSNRRETSRYDSTTWKHSGAQFDSGNSTDSLIDEADEMLRNNKSERLRSKSRVDSCIRTEPKRNLRHRTLSSGNLDSSRLYPSVSFSHPVNETSVSGSIRTRSETDLRLLGRLGEGTRAEPPYLPYRNEHLSIGQLVKVLVPGGVALGRVAYAPSYSSMLQEDHLISVVLLSEPSLFAGNIVSVPVNRVLLAWPKSSDCYRNL